MSPSSTRRLAPALTLALVVACAAPAAAGGVTRGSSATPAAAAPVGPQRPAEAPLIEHRLQEIERLAERDPQRALQAIAVLGHPAMSAYGRLRLATARARIAVYQLRAQEALAETERAWPAAAELDDPWINAQLLACRGVALSILNRPVEALASGEQARTQADRSGDAKLRVDTRIFLADFAAHRGDYERAFSELGQAETIAATLDSAGVRAAIAYTGARLASAMDDLPAALQAFAEAEAGFAADADPLGEADSARLRATLLVHEGRAAEAQEPLQRALARYQALGDEFGVAVGNSLLGRVLAANGAVDRGLVLSARSIRALRSMDSSQALAGALIDRATLLASHRHGQGARPLIEEAGALLQRADDLRLRLRLLAATADVQAALGHWREAHAALAELLQLRQHHYEQRLSRQLAAQRGRLDSQRMAADLERARRQADEQREALAAAARAARAQTALILLACLAVAAALYALLRSARRNRRNSALAQTDFLTGIPNRRHISELGRRLLARCRDRGEPLSVLLADLDYFKSINDRHGHPAGDRALRAVANELKRRLRTGDEIGRYGGEEFAIVLPQTSLERALAIAERLRGAIAALGPQDIDLDSGLTVSIGVATLRSDDDFDALLARADHALYASKQGGRNRISVDPGARSAAGAGADRSAGDAGRE